MSVATFDESVMIPAQPAIDFAKKIRSMSSVHHPVTAAIYEAADEWLTVINELERRVEIEAVKEEG